MTARHDSDLPAPEPKNTDGEGAGEPSEGAGEPSEGGGLRRRYEEALHRIAELESEKETETGDLQGRLLAQEFDRLGLDPDTGVGKAVALTFDGEPEQLQEFVAEEFGFVPVNPVVPKIAASYAALDGLAGAAGSITPPSEAQQLAKAEAKGDTDTSLGLKSAQLGKMLRP